MPIFLFKFSSRKPSPPNIYLPSIFHANPTSPKKKNYRRTYDHCQVIIVTWPELTIVPGALSYFLPCFFCNRSHETGPTQTVQTEPRIGQIAFSVEQNLSDTAERNLTWREWVQYWQEVQDRPSTSRNRKLPFRASE
jgi:hypothetical protein